MNKDWYGDQLKGTFLTDTVVPILCGCVPFALLILSIVMRLE